MIRNLAGKLLGALCMPYRKLRRMMTTPPGTIVYGDGKNLSIGKNVSFGGRVVLFGTAPITIGDNTMIALNTIIHTSTHDYQDHPMWTKRIDRPVQIGSHVWIGAAAVILPGVVVEDYAVIGSGSVVTARVPRGAVVVGNPARIMRYRDPSFYERAPGITSWDECEIIAEGFVDKVCKKG